MTDVRERLADGLYAAGWGLVRGLPEGVARSAFRLGADLAVRRGGAGVRQLRRNLARVVPGASAAELDDLVRRGMRSYARYWLETFRLPAMDTDAVFRRVDASVEGLDLLEAGLASGRGVVAALPHTGNVDVAGLWLARSHGPFTTVAERLRPESLFQRFVAYRESLGFEVLPLTGGGSQTYRRMVRRLEGNGIVCLVADRDLTRMGVPVTFFGEQTRMPAGPARLAATTGATLIACENVFTDDGGWRIRFHSPRLVGSRAEVGAAVQSLADAFAADIARRPADWHMLQKLWVADLDEPQRRALAPAG